MHRTTVILALLLLLPAGIAHAAACDDSSLVPDSAFCLTGITAAPSRTIATFADGATTRSMDSGETLAGWKLVSIAPGAVTIEREGTRRALVLGTAKGVAPPGPSAANGPKQHSVSPLQPGKAKSIAVRGGATPLSISTHLPPVQDY